jgi:hypothetical protein
MPVERSPDSSIITRSFAVGDETKILDLFARSFHTVRPLEEWRWRYEHDPAGAHHISVSLDSAGCLIGHYAGYPVEFWTQRDGGWSAHQIGDTMTAVGARHFGRGPSSVLGQTAEHFYQHFCRGKVAFNYGFNTANIQRFSVRFLGSTRVEDAPHRTLDLERSPLIPQKRLLRRLRGYTLELITTLDQAEWDDFFSRVAASYGFLLRRDAVYVRWRYLMPVWMNYIVIAVRRHGLLVGWSVFRVIGDRLVWGDALFDSRCLGSVEVLLRHVVPLFSRHGARQLDGWFPDRPSWFSAVLESIGFVRAAEPQGLALMCVPFEQSESPRLMAESLYYTSGDSDLF